MVRRRLCPGCHRPLDARLWEARLWNDSSPCGEVPHYDPETICLWVLRAQVQAGLIGGRYDGGEEGETYSLAGLDDGPRYDGPNGLNYYTGPVDMGGPSGPDLRDGGSWA